MVNRARSRHSIFTYQPCIPHQQSRASASWDNCFLLSSETVTTRDQIPQSTSDPVVTMHKVTTRLTPCLRRLPVRSFSTTRQCAADHVRLVEVGPRDGLQNEKKAISLDTKLELIRRLAGTGVTHLEAGSFVPAKWVPQVSKGSIAAAGERIGLTHVLRWQQHRKYCRPC